MQNCVQDILLEFGAATPGNVYVTDNASNMEAAFKGHTWLGCTCHNMNLMFFQGLHLTAGVGRGNEDSVPVKVTKKTEACKEWRFGLNEPK